MVTLPPVEERVARPTKHFEIARLEEKVRALPCSHSMVENQVTGCSAIGTVLSTGNDVVTKASVGSGATLVLPRQLRLLPGRLEASSGTKTASSQEQAARRQRERRSAVFTGKQGARHAFGGGVALQ